MLRYYMDHHVQAAVTAGLRGRGIDCLTTEEDGARLWDDARILQRATDLNRVLFSQDVDLLAIAAAWMNQGRPFCGLVYGRQLQLTIGQAVRDLELIALTLQADEIRNSVMHIPL